MKAKKIPMRRCIGCMEHFPKKVLCRIVKTKENEIFFDSTGKKNGRGAYICKNIDCLNKAIKSKALSRALETEIPEEVLEALKEAIVKNE